jgi:hypothetical protein
MKIMSSFENKGKKEVSKRLEEYAQGKAEIKRAIEIMQICGRVDNIKGIEESLRRVRGMKKPDRF